MHKQPFRGSAHKACLAGVLAGLSLWAGVQPALAQGTPPANKDDAPSEAARKAAASPYRFILLNANAPARKPSAPAAAAATAAPAPSAPATAAAEPVRRAAPVETAAVTRPTPAPAPAPAPAAAEPVPMPAAPVPQPSVAALTSKPPEPAPVQEVRRELIPVRTDEPRLTAAMLRDGISGKVIVQFDVRTDGSTADVKVVSSTHRALNRLSVEAVSTWKFRPVDEVLTVQTELVYTQ